MPLRICLLIDIICSADWMLSSLVAFSEALTSVEVRRHQGGQQGRSHLEGKAGAALARAAGCLVAVAIPDCSALSLPSPPCPGRDRGIQPLLIE